jgi:hypothetical protein
MLNRSGVFSLLKKIIIAIVITLFFFALASFPEIGYHGKASLIFPFKEGVLEGLYPYRIVNYSCDVSFNPFLYPFSWLQGKGHISGIFTMVYLPQSYGGTAPDIPPYHPSGVYWGTHEDMEQEGLMNVVLSQLTFLNALYVFIIVFIIELFRKHGLLLCLFVGIICFAFDGPLGGVIGFIFGVLLFILTMSIVKKTRWYERTFYPKEMHSES